MFSFFSRKQHQTPAAPKESDAMVIDSVPQQLRTPSPSEAASNVGLGPAAHMASPSRETPIDTLDPPKPPLPPTPEALHALVSTIPAKTLHAYVLAHLPTAPLDTLAALASFFATLAPPPRLHCVRCHSDYTEVENDDRSCHVPHDDDSANVERVGMGRGGSDYETHYGCCGKTVDGEGDLGPPDGWCYEGMHTTDMKRARFRADSTPANDMLDSCFRLNCHNIRARLPGARPRTSSSTGGVRAKRARPPPGDLADNDDDEDDDGNASRYTEDSGIAEIARGVGAMGQKAKGPRRPKAVARKSKPSAAATTETPARAHVRIKAPRGARESDAESSKAGSISVPPVSASAPAAGTPASASASSPAPAAIASRKRRPAAKPRRTPSPTRKPVSTSSKAPSTPAPATPAAAAAVSLPDSSPGPRGRKPRSPFKMDSVEIVVRSRSATRSRVRGSGGETADEKTMTDAEGKVRKRRKLAGGA
ncbi:hypothetical protein EDB89DRAFT_2103205 [Lactarius sanguifluus]|nr:hypothetical protein EDB89DRAFT_2103205 [Lactarius sanguifluus]